MQILHHKTTANYSAIDAAGVWETLSECSGEKSEESPNLRHYIVEMRHIHCIGGKSAVYLHETHVDCGVRCCKCVVRSTDEKCCHV